MISAGNSAACIPEQTKLSANLLSKLVEHLLLTKIDCLSFLHSALTTSNIPRF